MHYLVLDWEDDLLEFDNGGGDDPESTFGDPLPPSPQQNESFQEATSINPSKNLEQEVDTEEGLLLLAGFYVSCFLRTCT